MTLTVPPRCPGTVGHIRVELIAAWPRQGHPLEDIRDYTRSYSVGQTLDCQADLFSRLQREAIEATYAPLIEVAARRSSHTFFLNTFPFLELAPGLPHSRLSGLDWFPSDTVKQITRFWQRTRLTRLQTAKNPRKDHLIYNSGGLSYCFGFRNFGKTSIADNRFGLL